MPAVTGAPVDEATVESGTVVVGVAPTVDVTSVSGVLDGVAITIVVAVVIGRLVVDGTVTGLVAAAVVFEDGVVIVMGKVTNCCNRCGALSYWCCF